MNIEKIIEALGEEKQGELIILTDEKEIEFRNNYLFTKLMIENNIKEILKDDSRGYTRIFFNIGNWKIMSPER